VYRCAPPEESLALAVVTDEQWTRLCNVMGRSDWVRDPQLSTAAGRRHAHDAIDAALRGWLARQPRDDAVERLVTAGIPAHALINAHELMPNPQLEHRRFFQVLEHPYVGMRRFQGLPMRFSALGPDWHRSPPPTLGQHNDEVLGRELGLPASELARLRQDGIIGERPAFEGGGTTGGGG
jgi:crotonobetainyl-CoA:carnitine CoA-transferase CaiB-like acyl-CoA transferase